MMGNSGRAGGKREAEKWNELVFSAKGCRAGCDLLNRRCGSYHKTPGDRLGTGCQSDCFRNIRHFQWWKIGIERIMSR